MESPARQKPGSSAVLKRPDVCDVYPFGDVYMGAVTCNADEPGGGHVAEMWCER